MPAPILTTVRSQPTAVETLRHALRVGRVHHAYLFDGPEGVGKERAAFGLAQALVCERRASGDADACGACSPCTRARPRWGIDPAASSAAPRSEDRRPLHPDVVVLERGLYDPASIGRRSPETQEISIDQIRALVLGRAAFPPYEGRAKLFIVRRAEELSIAASNALLKTLEEPGRLTHFVLLSSVADSLLPTIRSRTQRVRFGGLPDDVVGQLLCERGVDPDRAARIAQLAGGSVSAALALSDPEESARRDAFLSRAMAALEARDLGPAIDLAEEAKKADKPTLIADLEALAGVLGALSRESVVASDRRAERLAARHDLAMTAARQIEANASAQLAMESMLIRMREA